MAFSLHTHNRIHHGLGSVALGKELTAVVANPAQKPSAQLVDALKHMLGSEAHAKEVFASIVSGAPLSTEAKRRICIGLASVEHGNAMIAEFSPASTPLKGL